MENNKTIASGNTAITLKQISDVLEAEKKGCRTLYVDGKGNLKTQGFLGTFFTLPITRQRTAKALLNAVLKDTRISFKDNIFYELICADRGNGFYVRDLKNAIVKLKTNPQKIIFLEKSKSAASEASPSLVDFMVTDYYASDFSYSVYVDCNNKVKTQCFLSTLFTSRKTWAKTNTALKNALVTTFGEVCCKDLNFNNKILKDTDVWAKLNECKSTWDRILHSTDKGVNAKR